ncbi:MAG: DUF1801 domain-containing protein [Bacteroidota bacterium]|nr:DUF1801 domain-containing protein [Bacteroidota bacterium]MDP4234778.1 DUF1801 domain-containing protein [Bacteroidota bacterium]MDP4244142.1 DUF1801 domain-containing protein [Bacteroidota bacterium]MDP4289302.1 DUF1801 domain-containing protein [Bacteroidota bacterium]
MNWCDIEHGARNLMNSPETTIFPTACVSVSMPTLSETDLKSLLSKLPASKRKIVHALRETIQSAAPNAEESILWGGLSYHQPEIGGRVKGAVCQIVIKRAHIRLDFIHGIWLKDPNGLLQGDLVSKRYIPIASIEDAERPAIKALIREAAKFDRSQFGC